MGRPAWFSSDRFVPPVERLDWGGVAIGMDRVPSGHTGRGVTVAILDSGIDRSHPDLPRATGRGFVQDEDPEVWGDDYGHGTFVSGIVAALQNRIGVLGIAPGVRLLTGRVGRVDPITRHFANDAGAALTAALDWAGNSGADVVNLSLEFSDLSAETQGAMDAALGRLAKRGVSIIASTGNGAKGTVAYPAASRWVLGVGAVGNVQQRANIASRAEDPSLGLFVPRFSNFGSGLDLLAPGVQVSSTHPVLAGSYARQHGTSLSAPYVAGVCALLVEAARTRSRSSAWVEEMFRTLRGTATQLRGVPSSMQGAGVINAAAALQHWAGA